MKFGEPIDLWDGIEVANPGNKLVSLTPYNLLDGDDFSAMLVLPGGGYAGCSRQEGQPVAAWLNSLGISAFVLDYRVSPAKHPSPYEDARRAMQFIRFHAKEFNIDPNRVGVIGFSAGGHLAATLSNHYTLKNNSLDDELEQVSARPDLAVLSYPVISGGDFAHDGSVENLMGLDQVSREKFSMELAVHADTPKSFLWHTAEDELVPVENSYLYAMALNKFKIPHELHVYPYGAHGLGLAMLDYRRDSHIAQWRQACEAWLIKEGF